MAKYYLPDILYGDKGYDDNNIFELCFENLKAYLLILQRRLNISKHKRKGAYRKLTFYVFDYGEVYKETRLRRLMA